MILIYHFEYIFTKHSVQCRQCALSMSGFHVSTTAESYDVCKKMIEMLGYTIKDIEDKNIADIDDRVKKIGLKEISKQLEIGEPTLRDIILEIKKPGRPAHTL